MDTKGNKQDLPVILVIEDDPILTKMYREKFANEGFEVLTALDGEVGLDMALKKPFLQERLKK